MPVHSHTGTIFLWVIVRTVLGNLSGPLSSCCLATKSKLNLWWLAKCLWYFPQMKEFLAHMKQVTSAALAALLSSIPNGDAPLEIQEKSGNGKWANQGLVRGSQGDSVCFLLFYHLNCTCVPHGFWGETEPCIFRQFNPSMSILAYYHRKEASIVINGWQLRQLTGGSQHSH